MKIYFFENGLIECTRVILDFSHHDESYHRNSISKLSKAFSSKQRFRVESFSLTSIKLCKCSHFTSYLRRRRISLLLLLIRGNYVKCIYSRIVNHGEFNEIKKMKRNASVFYI